MTYLSKQPNKRIFSGIQPTGNLHIGNYLGAIKNWIELQKESETIYSIVDMHALSVPENAIILGLSEIFKSLQQITSLEIEVLLILVRANTARKKIGSIKFQSPVTTSGRYPGYADSYANSYVSNPTFTSNPFKYKVIQPSPVNYNISYK